MRWLHASLSLFVCLCGCPKRDTDEAVDPVDLAVQRVDAAWSDRAEIGLHGVEVVVDEAMGSFPGTPALQWRASRLWVAKGLVAHSQQEEVIAYARARSLAVECLDAEPRFQQKRIDLGWAAALPEVPGSSRSCVGWTTWSWVRWLEAMGEGPGSLDLARVEVLINELEPEGHLAGGPAVLWVRGLFEAARAEDEEGLERAAVLLRQATIQDPDEVALRADLVLEVAVPLDDRTLIGRQLKLMEESPQQTPEARRAREKVAGL